ncbi:MAG: putative bifunctional diguanylate cyclase/phosphodiesterase, partial [Pseudomonadales bacterium]
ISAAFMALALLCMFWAASSRGLPQSFYPENVLSRPYDIAPIVLFVFALFPLVALYRKMPTMLNGALIVCVIPQVVLELHMAFGSIRLFDNHFNIAHALKIVAYLVPFIGLIMHYYRSYTKIDHALYHDALTATANRIYFFELAKRALAQAARHDRQVALFYMDVNRFKEINDTYGHDVGDTVLVNFAERMQALTRAEDCFARLGGDEFVLLIDDVAHIEHLETVAEKIVAMMQKPVSTAAGNVQANVSIGISLFPDADNLQDLVKHADLAMYEAKRQEDSSYQIYTAALSARHSEEICLQRAMPKGLQEGHMRLVYQPVFDTKTRTPTAFEALLRWDDPQRGRISPEIFVPIAEKTNFIHTLGLWVFDKACAQLAQWQKIYTRPLQMHINMSARQFHNKHLALQIANIFYAHGLDGRSIVIEITEGQLIEDIDKCKETIAELKRMGITFALDDYGSGFASITHLRELPIDYLKIDRCLIHNSPRDNRNKILTKTTIELAHSLGLKVVAEGIETKGELRLIRQLGCNFAQGFFLARPLSAMACAELLQPVADDQSGNDELAVVEQLTMPY